MRKSLILFFLIFSGILSAAASDLSSRCRSRNFLDFQKCKNEKTKKDSARFYKKVFSSRRFLSNKNSENSRPRRFRVTAGRYRKGTSSNFPAEKSNTKIDFSQKKNFSGKFFTEKKFKKFTAAKTNFAILLPENFVKIEDTLDENSGKIVFRSGKNVVEFFAENEFCRGGIGIMHTCLTEKSEKFAAQTLEKFPGTTVEKRENFLLREKQFESEKKIRNLGKLTELWNEEHGRIWQLIFFDPKKDFLWKSEFREFDDEIFLDNFSKNKIFKSIFNTAE